MQLPITKENFFNEMQQIYPNAMKIFCDWIDLYKKKNNWKELFNETGEGDCGNGSCGWPENYAPKFHDLPYEMQKGIILEFLYQKLNIVEQVELFAKHNGLLIFNDVRILLKESLRTIENNRQ